MQGPTRTQHQFAAIAGCLLVGLLHVCFSNPALAEPRDEIQIRADYMKFDLETGDSIYQGNVSIMQGGIELTGETVTIHREQKQDREISDIEVTGKPARYLQDENTSNKVHAVSQHMKYSARENRLVMTTNARLEQSEHIVESQRIVYDTVKKVIIAGTESPEKTTSDRVNITLTPKKNNPNESH